MEIAIFIIVLVLLVNTIFLRFELYFHKRDLNRKIRHLYDFTAPLKSNLVFLKIHVKAILQQTGHIIDNQKKVSEEQDD